MSERAPVVLLVDDEERILSALRRTLRRVRIPPRGDVALRAGDHV